MVARRNTPPRRTAATQTDGRRSENQHAGGKSTQRRSTEGFQPVARDGAAPDLSTTTRLVAAADAEFSEAGYFASDTNKIARRAGFAPQTFYRHFEDKLAIFIAVYAQWRRAEAAAVNDALAGEPVRARRAEAAARILIAFHRRSRCFRRSLRILAIEETRVRAARAESRLAQATALAGLPSNRGRALAAILAAILEVERLCDAIADGELEDLGVSASAAERAVAAAVRRARGEQAC